MSNIYKKNLFVTSNPEAVYLSVVDELNAVSLLIQYVWI